MMMKRMIGKKQIELLFQKEIKQNREYIKRMKNKNLSAFIIEKMEVDIYAEHKSIRND